MKTSITIENDTNQSNIIEIRNKKCFFLKLAYTSIVTNNNCVAPKYNLR